MSNFNEELSELHDKMRRAYEAGETIIQRCIDEGRERTSEEDEQFDRTQADVERLQRQIVEVQKRAETEGFLAETRRAFESVIHPESDTAKRGESEAVNALDRFLRSGKGSFDLELSGAQQIHDLYRAGADWKEIRSILGDGGASGGSLVEVTTVARTIYAFMEAESAIRRLSTVMQSSDGGDWTLPRVNTHGVGTQVSGQGTALAGTEPVFDTITLGAYKYGQLVQVSREMVEDSAFDIIGFVAENIGRAVGRIASTAYATGSGSGAPNGVVTAATGSVVTGGSLITVDGEDLINVQHAVVQSYRDRGVYVMKDSTLGTLRKLRADAGGTTGPWLLEPPSAPGQPLGFFGRPVYTDFNIAAQGSNSKSVLFGDLSKYYIRDVNSFRLERSDDYAFNTDLVSFRGVLRTDGDLVDTNAVAVVKQNVS